MSEAKFKLNDLDTVNVDALLRDVSVEEPCGANLEYDPVFLELEQALQGRPEVEYGVVVSAATPPDWKLIASLALQLFSRAHDLRVAVSLARALLHVRGFTGFSVGLKLIERLIESRWALVHPQLDPNDNHDPMLRVNILSTLVDVATVLREVKEAPIVVSNVHGNFCLRDIDIITGEISATDIQEKPSMPALDAAISDLDQSEIDGTCQALELAVYGTVRIETILTEHVGVSRTLDLSPLTDVLMRARDCVQKKRSRKIENANIDGSEIVAFHTPASTVATNDITSREDVARMLKKMCAYFASHEPSSPIPLLLQRAQRLIDKNFVEILQELSPESLNQIYQICGTQEESSLM